MAAVMEEHNLRLLNERANTLLNHEPTSKLALKDNITFNFERPTDLLTSNVFSLLLKPASELKTLESHNCIEIGAVYSVTFSPDNKLIASVGYDKTVRLWNIPSGELNAELKGHENWVYSVAFSPDGQSIVTGSEDKTVRTWSVATKQQLKTLSGHSDSVNSVAWSPNGDVIASGSQDNTVILWDAISGSVKKKLTDHTNGVSCLLDESCKYETLFVLLGWSVSFSQNGNKLASTSEWDKTAIIWDVDSGAALIILTHSDAVLSVCFSHNDQFVVTGCRDKIVRMFDVNTGHEEKRFEGHTDSVQSVACSFDGSIIASGGGNIFGGDKSVRLWDVASTKQLQQLDGHTEMVFSVAFSHDGKFIASGSSDDTVRLWNASSLFQIPYEPKELEEEEEESRKRQKIDHK